MPYHDDELQSLALAVQNGCQKSFEPLLKHLTPLIRYKIRSYYHEWYDRDDLFQICAMNIFLSLRRYRPIKSFTNYASIVIRNCLVETVFKGRKRLKLSTLKYDPPYAHSPLTDLVIQEAKCRQRSHLITWHDICLLVSEHRIAHRRKSMQQPILPKTLPKMRPVLRVDTNTVFDDAICAARAVGPQYGKGNITYAIRRNVMFNGSKWRWAEPQASNTEIGYVGTNVE